ncbi:aldehyde dehydrogenase family protein [Nonomuraea sp. bgisy101]|uniref:aldehyde dehydrogenase family protein n=1 Tax=Nonomuraea sp. bgisy101 TaxID=3413784 RepID=UPI003D70B010
MRESLVQLQARDTGRPTPQLPPSPGRDEYWPLFAGGSWSPSDHVAAVTDPDTGDLVGQVAMAGHAEAEAALAAAVRTMEGPRWPAGERAAVLDGAAERIGDAGETFARLIAAEGIKTIREARKEVARAAHTLRLSAAAALGPAEAAPPADDRPGTAGWRGFVHRQPVGVVLAITPYNDPLNLVAHKVGPALAAGNAVVVKPHERTPLSALLLARALSDAGLPPGRLSVLPGDATIASSMIADPRVRFVSFTGGRTVGARVHRTAGLKRTLMELGGICPTILMEDTDLDLAVPALVDGAFGAAGQNCLHVQRILVHRSLYAEARERLIEATTLVRGGPKSREDSEMGPLIDAAALQRVSGLVNNAHDHGAIVLAGGDTDGPRYLPTLLENLPDSADLSHEEVFGPVVGLEAFDTASQAIEMANRSGGGIQAGVFTRNLEVAETLAAALDFGGVVIGGTSDRRSDALPFGGTGNAGHGREGVGYAAAAMAELKTVLMVPTGP